MNKIHLIWVMLILTNAAFAQRNVTTANDSNTPLHLLKPDYPVEYGIPKIENIKANLDQIHAYLDQVTPTEFVNTKTNEAVIDLSKIDENTALKKGDFRLVSYEWGVVYGAMLAASQATGDTRFENYVEKRLQFIANAAPYFKKTAETNADWGTKGPLKNLLTPHALDDCGAMCAAMIKAVRNGSKANLRPLIDTHIDYILKKEHHLKDGTLARNRPQANTLWLDDLFMGVPALAQMGKLTGDRRYFDEATKQVLLYSKRMFNKEKGVYMHGWVEAMTDHPQYHWARANGWAILTKVELLDVLPQNHPNRPAILALLKAHVRGLAAYQSGSGFWHQLLDRSDSYLETSATAIYTYAIAKAVNRGWVDALAYSPVALLGWNAVATKINDKGQVEGTCVGTGMAFDPAFYYHRPISPFAAHGYGPTILAASEIINLLKTKNFEINDSSVQLKGPKEQSNVIKAQNAYNVITVAQDGSGQFMSIQAAINSLDTTATTQRTIFIKNGVYHEKLMIDKSFLKLVGESEKGVVVQISLARDVWRCQNPDDYGAATVNVKSHDLRIENLTVINSYGFDAKGDTTIVCDNELGQAGAAAKDRYALPREKGEATGTKVVRKDGHQFAFRSMPGATRLSFWNCTFRAGGGDTVSPWDVEGGMYYFKNCTMEGGVDFYCPRGWAWAESCRFICHSKNAAILHDGTNYESSKTVLNNCTFEGEEGYKLGRYHRPAQFYLLDCQFDSNIADADIYHVSSSPDPRWGHRVYYYNCHRTGGDYGWHANNLPIDLKTISLSWLYEGRWLP